MKGLNTVLAFVGGAVLIVGAIWLVIAGIGAIRQAGYEIHEAMVADELKAGNASVAELKAKKEELKVAEAAIASLNSQLELAKAEHTVLTPAFKALIDLKGDFNECEAKDPANGFAKCKYAPAWWTNHAINVTASEIVVNEMGKGYNAKELAKYEFVRDAKGDIVDFKLVPAKQAVQN
jgi:hypothetical protein